MVMDWVESNSVCNHTSEYDYLHELDETRFSYQLMIKITISEKRRRDKLWKKEKICMKRLIKEA